MTIDGKAVIDMAVVKMLKEPIKILIVTDDTTQASSLTDIINNSDLSTEVSVSSEYHQIMSTMSSCNYDMYLVDNTVFSGRGMQFIKTAREQGSTAVYILMCGDNLAGMEKALDFGASSYIEHKDIENSLLYVLEHSYYANVVSQKSRKNDKYMRILSQSQPVGMLLVSEDLTVKMANNFAMHMAGEVTVIKEGTRIGEVIKCSQSSVCNCSESGENCITDCDLTGCIVEVFKSGRGVLYREMELNFSSEKFCSQMWARVSVKPVFVDGERHVVLTIDDLTQRHEMELLLQKAQCKAREDHKKMKDMNNQLQQIVSQTNEMVQEAFAANKAKNDFMANISHELRTPLNGIQGFCQLLLEEELSEQERDYAQTIYGCTKDLIRVLNNVLEFTRLEKNNISMARIWFNVDDIVDDIMVMYKDAAEAKGLEFIIHKSASCPHEIRSDQAKLKQSLFNIVENAIKYTDSGKVVINVSGQNLESNECVCFDIIDTGIGMSAESRLKIFESFSQADSSVTRKYDGLGLGLSVSKRYIALLSGEIELESSEGIGSKFSIIIPVDKQIKKIKVSDRTKEARQASGILVVEGEPHHADIIGRYLKQMQVKSEIVTNGSDAIEKIANKKYNYVLLDISLPILRDESIIDMVKESSHAMPIVGLCSGSDNYTMELCKKLGCKRTLNKPVDKSKLDAITIEFCSIPEEVVEASLDTDAQDFFAQSSEIVEYGSGGSGYGVIEEGLNQDKTPIYSTLADDTEMYEVVEYFLSMLPEYVQSLTQAIENGVSRDIVRVAFDMRDSAGAAGFPTLRLKVVELEKAAMENDYEKVKLLFPEVRNIASRVALVGIGKAT